MTTGLMHPDLPPGSEIGGYRLSGLLGKGGMGAVYLAEQLSLGRQVALKVLSNKQLDSENKVKRFLAEAQLAAKLSHPGLVTIHEVGHDYQRQLYFYSMECVHGRTLNTVINQQGPLNEKTAVNLFVQIASALAHAHKQGLMHRDIKPENILIAKSGVAKLADLGLATAEARGLGQSGPRVLSVIGTPGWSPPEQLRDPGSISPASDVFSLGCVLAYMLTGEKPFTGVTLLDLAINVATADVGGLSQIGMPLREIVAYLTAKDPTHRPENGHKALMLFANDSNSPPRGNPITPSASGSAATPRSRRRTRRRR